MKCARALLLTSLWAVAAAAQPISTSPAPDAVAVTIYRAPGRPADEAMNLRWLNGYALISETRRVDIPAGEADIRFEGVAGGIIPESAIVTGLPTGVVEKNQDAWLLSPASLLDRSLGRRVHIRRTSGATGEVREYEAVVRTSADGAVVLQTEAGFEALRCTGLKETIVYPSVPEGLSAKPTLSVRTRSPAAASAVVTLSYLATGFDWQANYVATLNRAEDRVDLFGWVTLANGDETSFVDAGTQTVAGRPNREDEGRRNPPRSEGLQLKCWPQGTTTSDLPVLGLAPPPPSPPPPPAAPMMDEIVVTGSRIERRALQSATAVTAVQEELGDLKLYRIPVPVTVASNSQKQVALLDRERVKVASLYRQRLYAASPEGSPPVLRVLTTRNRTAEGLGLPLPAGRVVLFSSARERPVLLGEGFVDDRAIGEDVEIEIAEALAVRTEARKLRDGEDRDDYALVVTNDRAQRVKFEAELDDPTGTLRSRARLGRRDGRYLWSVTVPANGRVTLFYSLADES